MPNQFINFFNDNVKITESREYLKFFDEPGHAYNESCNKNFLFMLRFDYCSNTGHIEIPNCGGMVDEFPKSQLQLDWTISKLGNHRVDKIWPTKWNFLDKESYTSFIKTLNTDAKLNQISFSSDIAEVNQILRHVYKSNLSISKLIINNGSKVDGFDADILINKHLNELANNNVYSKHKYVAILNKIFNTDKITIDSKTHVYFNFE